MGFVIVVVHGVGSVDATVVVNGAAAVVDQGAVVDVAVGCHQR